MAYNQRNKLKQYQRIIDIYNEIKQPDIPDTQIISKELPKHNVFISYRTWMSIKGMKPSELDYDGQLAMF